MLLRVQRSRVTFPLFSTRLGFAARHKASFLLQRDFIDGAVHPQLKKKLNK
jgi:hypothetical protein